MSLVDPDKLQAVREMNKQQLAALTVMQRENKALKIRADENEAKRANDVSASTIGNDAITSRIEDFFNQIKDASQKMSSLDQSQFSRMRDELAGTIVKENAKLAEFEEVLKKSTKFPLNPSSTNPLQPSSLNKKIINILRLSSSHRQLQTQAVKALATDFLQCSLRARTLTRNKM